MDTKRLSLRNAGIFSNVNEVVQQLYLAEKTSYQFVIDWSKSCYREKNLTGYIIGLHIRGAGRTHGGVPELRKKHKRHKGVPFSPYFAAVDQEIKKIRKQNICMFRFQHGY